MDPGVYNSWVYGSDVLSDQFADCYTSGKQSIEFPVKVGKGVSDNRSNHYHILLLSEYADFK